LEPDIDSRPSFLRRVRSFLWSELPPWKMALSAGIGAFVAMTPTIGLQTVIVLGLVSIVRGNRGIGLLASALANPWTIPFIFYADFRVGSLILGGGEWRGLPERFTFGSMGEAFLHVLLGSIMVGIAAGLLAALPVYLLCRYSGLESVPKRPIDKSEELV
jgi:uncharacterized protein (DUF2062 family)